ncbi:hypothetical protein CRG98_046440 [Punica granatum]|uniref:Uncharacterized protein n=2 Tax=Punica granatum TaxID=22663 RepID=A0A2I0HN67_PUNGR|nr:hypothetical protein CRG98_046440 [Punica granatum]
MGMFESKRENNISCIRAFKRMNTSYKQGSKVLASLSCREMLPSPGVRGKESETWPWESRDSDGRLRVRDPKVGNRCSPWKNGSAPELRARHGARSGPLDSLGADLGVRGRSRTC